MEREQIDAWLAVEFALDCIDDHFDKVEFLKDCHCSDMVSIKEDWPEFVDWVENEKKERGR
jgi:hypothetical protein